MPKQIINKVLHGRIYLFGFRSYLATFKPSFGAAWNSRLNYRASLLSNNLHRLDFSSLFNFNRLQLRFGSRGTDYQPSTRKRKRTFGFLARIRSVNGRKIIQRRLKKGRKNKSH